MVQRYAKPKPAEGLPKWFLQIRAGSDFMPAKIKPYSYEKMAAAESRNRQALYSSTGWSTPAASVANSMTLGTQYWNKPTEDVATGIKKNYNLTRDEIALGQEPPKPNTGFFARAIDVMSRPLYSFLNMHKANVDRNYRTADSDGGEQVTLKEHLLGVGSDIFNNTIFGLGKNVAQGTLDDRAKDAWAGLSGKEKTNTHKILETEYSGFAKEHPKTALFTSILGDIVFDPLTWATLGVTGPGTVTKSLGAAALGSVGKKTAAKSILQETLLTPTGLRGAKEALRTDRYQAELRKLTRQKNSLNRQERRAAEGKYTRLTDAQRKAKIATVRQALNDASIDHIKGSDFAWRVIKSSIPTLGLNTLSKANMGASVWRKTAKSEELLKNYNSFVKAAAVDAVANHVYSAIYHAGLASPNGLEDVHYNIGKVRYVIPLSKATNEEEFAAEIIKATAPIAKMAEHNLKAGRSRKARNLSVETRGRAAVQALDKKYGNLFSAAMSPDSGKHFDSLRGSAEAIYSPKTVASKEEAMKPKNVYFDSEEEMLNHTVDELHNMVKKKKKGKKKYSQKDATVFVRDANDVIREVNLETLRTAQNKEMIYGKLRRDASAARSARSAEQVAADTGAGLSDAVVTAREGIVAAVRRAQAGEAAAETANMVRADNIRQAENSVAHAETNITDADNALGYAEEELTEGGRGILDYIQGLLSSDKFSNDTKAEFLSILNDKTLSHSQRIEKLLTHEDLSNNSAIRAMKDHVNFKIVDGQLIADGTGLGENEQNLVNLINTVLKDRLDERVTPEMLKASGIKITMKDGVPQIVKSSAKSSGASLDYLGDVNNEIGMAMLDAYRLAIDFAVASDEMQVPERAFIAISNTMDKFLEGATADIKRQVFQVMYEATGMRLPEKFVPQMDEVIARLPGVPGTEETTYKFLKADGKTELVNQDLPWRNLALDMQRWVYKVFSFVKPKLANPSMLSAGGDLDDLGKQLVSLSQRTLPAEAVVDLEPIDKAMGVLRLATAPVLLNGEKQVVNRYSITDFLLHGKEILLSQDETLRIANTDKGAAVRRTVGRLSAVDSFSYVPDEVRAAIKVIEDLKTQAKSDETAQIILAKLFVDNGGLDHLTSLKTATGDAKDIDFINSFKTLGIHARLKHDAVSRGARTLETKHRADLMDEFWRTQSINHEWQKAMHHRILVDTIMNGKTVNHTAQTIAKNLDEVFAPYEGLQAKLRPHSKFGDPIPELNSKVQFENLPTPTEGAGLDGVAPPVSRNPDDIASVENLMRARSEYGSAINTRNRASADLEAARNVPEAKVDPALRQGVTDAQDAYKAAHAAGPGGAPVGKESTGADFANVDYSGLGYSDEELKAIQGWIAMQYADTPPQKLAMDLNAISKAMTQDMMEAQSEVIQLFKDFSIKHKTELNIFGVPLMSMANPMNSTHDIAGVTTLAQQKSKGGQFWNRLTNPFSELDWVERRALNSKKRTHIINQGLDHILTETANAATTYRKEWIPRINEMYKRVHRGPLEDSTTNAMNRKSRSRLMNKLLFSKAIPDSQVATRVFNSADGTNYLDEITEDFRQVGARAFAGYSKEGWNVRDALTTFNKYMHGDYRLTFDDISMIADAYKSGAVDSKLIPYSTEWLKQVGAVLDAAPKSKLSGKRLENIKLGGLNYAIHDAYVKQAAGSALHEGVFSTFATQFSNRNAAFLNDVVSPQTIGSDGRPMRGKLVPVESLYREGTSTFIDRKYIPKRMIGTGYYISEDILPDIKLLFKYMEQTHELNDVIDTQFLNKVLSYFKSAVTVYNIPTYPIRNLISDVFMSAMDGLVNPRYYKDAMALWWEHKQELKNMNPRDYNEILDQNWMRGELHRAMGDPESVMQPNVNPNSPVRLRVQTSTGVQELNSAQIYQAFDQLSLSQNRTAYDIPRAVAAARGNALGLAGGKVSDKIMELNDVREDWARMAHFMYAIEREAPLGGTIDDVFRRAADRVIKYHFDYSDTSLFDMKYTAKMIPFYKWTKNVIPFTITNVLFKPKFLNIERALSEAMGAGIDDDSDEGYLPDIVMPSWIKHDLPVPIGTWSDPNGAEFQQFALMYLPLGDTMTKTLAPSIDPWFNPNIGLKEKALQTGNAIVGTAGEMSIPPIKALTQAATGQVMHGSGSAPEKPDENWFNTLTTMIPGNPTLTGLQKSIEGIAGADGEQGKNKTAEVLKALGIVKTYNNSENNQLSELRQREDVHRGVINKGKAELSVKLKEKYPNATPDQIEAIIDEYLKEVRKMDSGRL